MMVILELVGLLLIALLLYDCLKNVFMVWHKKLWELKLHKPISWSEYKLIANI